MLIQCSPPPVCHMSHVMCYASYVMCHMSCVMRHMSCVTCHMSHVNLYNFFFLHISQPSWWIVCYKRGLPRLVFFNVYKQSLRVCILICHGNTWRHLETNLLCILCLSCYQNESMAFCGYRQRKQETRHVPALSDSLRQKNSWAHKSCNLLF